MNETERIAAPPRQSIHQPIAESPLHGFQGDRGPAPDAPTVPASLTIAVSREAGARGGTIGRRVAKKLGWPIYDQEILEYTAQEGASRHIIGHLPAAAARWAACAGGCGSVAAVGGGLWVGEVGESAGGEGAIRL